MLTGHWLTAWTKICSATFLLSTLKWRIYFPEICLTDGIPHTIWVTFCQLKTVHGYFYQEPTRKTHQWNFVPCLKAFSLFQPGGDSSHTSLTIDEVSWWYLLASLLYFPLFLEFWTSEKEEVPKRFHLYLYTQSMGFSIRSSKYCWCFQCLFLQFLPGPSSSWKMRAELRSWGHLGRLQVGCLCNFHLNKCRIVPMCIGVLKKPIISRCLKNNLHRF